MADEFDEKSVVPLSTFGRDKLQWTNCGPTYQGTLTPCFKSGLLFRIVNDDEQTWAFYNDTCTYEMKVQFTFGKDSDISALTGATMTTDAEGAFVVTAVVEPLQTCMFIKGAPNGFKSHFEPIRLSNEYLERARAAAAETTFKERTELEKKSTSRDSEELLQAAMNAQLPFVDPAFPPSQASLEPQQSQFTPVPWKRPEDFLPKEYNDQVRLFRGPLNANSIERGEFGDSWVLSAMAYLTTNPSLLRGLFTHPVSAGRTAQERAVGAYRCLLNKDGFWQSYVLDNYLPVLGSKVKFAHSKADPCEQWVSFLEKAYAKRLGSYAAISAGDPLVAVRDFTGFPTARVDADFIAAKGDAAKGEEFCQRLISLRQKGHSIIFSVTGASTSDPKYKDSAIPLGYSLVVLDMKNVMGQHLFRLQNPWKDISLWNGTWGPQAKAWTDNPKAAMECGVHDGSDGCMWLSLAEVNEYFTSCGVVYNFPNFYDYRIHGCFTDVHPDVCLQIKVRSSTELTLVISQKDLRGTPDDNNYAGVMLSVCTLMTKEAEGVQHTGELEEGQEKQIEYEVVLNSTADNAAPGSRFTFFQGRDVSLSHTFTPEKGTYLIVPRRIAGGATKELPFSLGVLSPTAVGPNASVSVSFVKLPADNMVFDNFPQFGYDVSPVEAEYQTKMPNAHLESNKGTQLA